MSLAKLTRPKANRVIGIDASTKSLAFAIFEAGEFVGAGEIPFVGSDVATRLQDAKKKTAGLVKIGYLKADYIAIEAAIMVRNIETAIDLAYVYGAIMGELGVDGAPVEKIYPISWQTAIGVPNLKKAEKEQIKADNPGKSATWYSNEGRKMRKQRIADWASQFIDVSKYSDNVTDAMGIAYVVSEKLTRR